MEISASCPELNVEYLGYDTNTSSLVPSWQVCSAMCGKSDQCLAWSWVTSGLESVDEREKCYLMNDTLIDNKQERNGVISGAKGCKGKSAIY